MSGTEDTGGLVGAIFHPGGVIVGSTAGVQVTGGAAGLYIGGLAGFNSGLIIDSHATGDVDWCQVGWRACWVELWIRGRQQDKREHGQRRVTGTGNLVGGLVGWNNGPISSSHATGDVDGVRWVGGLVGSNFGAGGVNRISGSTAGGAVTGTGNLVGGLVGFNNGPISSSHATGDVDGATYVGGLVGSNGGAGGVNRISGSTAGGAVTGSTDFVGGLVGWNNGPISGSHATGDVNGSASVGGLVGLNNGADGVNKISGSTASGAVTGTGTGGQIGGLVGWNNGPISSSHATGTVSGSRTVGGLVGSSYDDDAWNGLAVGLNAITWSTASGLVEATGNFAGGLAGWNNGPISDSDARGARVSGLGSVGGLVGANSNGPGDGVNTIMPEHCQRRRDRHRQQCRWVGRVEQWPDQR